MNITVYYLTHTEDGVNHRPCMGPFFWLCAAELELLSLADLACYGIVKVELPCELVRVGARDASKESAS
jgi:hypothetical protein